MPSPPHARRSKPHHRRRCAAACRRAVPHRRPLVAGRPERLAVRGAGVRRGPLHRGGAHHAPRRRGGGVARAGQSMRRRRQALRLSHAGFRRRHCRRCRRHRRAADRCERAPARRRRRCVAARRLAGHERGRARAARRGHRPRLCAAHGCGHPGADGDGRVRAALRAQRRRGRRGSTVGVACCRKLAWILPLLVCTARVVVRLDRLLSRLLARKPAGLLALGEINGCPIVFLPRMHRIVEVDTQSAGFSILTFTLHHAYPRGERSEGHQERILQAHGTTHSTRNGLSLTQLFATGARTRLMRPENGRSVASRVAPPLLGSALHQLTNRRMQQLAKTERARTPAQLQGSTRAQYERGTARIEGRPSGRALHCGARPPAAHTHGDHESTTDSGRRRPPAATTKTQSFSGARGTFTPAAR